MLDILVPIKSSKAFIYFFALSGSSFKFLIPLVETFHPGKICRLVQFSVDLQQQQVDNQSFFRPVYTEHTF